MKAFKIIALATFMSLTACGPSIHGKEVSKEEFDAAASERTSKNPNYTVATIVDSYKSHNDDYSESGEHKGEFTNQNGAWVFTTGDKEVEDYNIFIHFTMAFTDDYFEDLIEQYKDHTIKYYLADDAASLTFACKEVEDRGPTVMETTFDITVSWDSYGYLTNYYVEYKVILKMSNGSIVNDFGAINDISIKYSIQ